MDSLSFTFQPVITSNLNSVRQSISHIRGLTVGGRNISINFRLNNRRLISVCSISKRKSEEKQEEEEEEEVDGMVEEVRVPDAWLNSSKASEESEWLRVTLHKWLDDEYIPEPTNDDISKVAARSYYNSLMENQTDLGDILLRMAMELETISYKESFHGAFSSANAAINLILERIVQE